MQYRTLGKTGIQVSTLAFGAGPVPAVMTAGAADTQRGVVRRALDAGINWFDTAATYGDGQSERSLGAAFEKLGVADRVQIATKVRLMPDQLDDIRRHVRASVAGSLERLGVDRVCLVQLHNAVTRERGDQSTSITPDDLTRPGGVLEAFEELQSEGRVEHLGLTGIGHADALVQAVRTGRFATMQVPYNVLNPSAGQGMPTSFQETDLGDIIAECARIQMGVFAIRVFAGGALAAQPPSEHTQTTRFFPLDLYHRDQQRAAQLEQQLAGRLDLKEAALRFVLSHRDITSAIVGFGHADHVDQAVAYAERGPLPADVLDVLRGFD